MEQRLRRFPCGVGSIREAGNVGRGVYCGKRAVFRGRNWIHDWLRAARGEGETGMIETGLLGLVTILLLIYLVYALLRPEKF